jgi:peptidoglycan LD-endopeptidase CwlK
VIWYKKIKNIIKIKIAYIISEEISMVSLGNYRIYKTLLFLAALFKGFPYVEATCDAALALERLKLCYPDHIMSADFDAIVWKDGTRMGLGRSDPFKTDSDKLNNPLLIDQLEQPLYYAGHICEEPQEDPGRIRYEPFFRKMYGDCPQEVEAHLEAIVWMPKIFGDNTYVLFVTRVNDVHKKIQVISDELEQLVLDNPEYISFLEKPGGTYCWRMIANTTRLSNHSFGMTLDINAKNSNYWQWDLQSESRPVTEDEKCLYRNSVPWEIVEIFEKQGFIWGGKWYHYDTMHFEYRPELIINE